MAVVALFNLIDRMLWGVAIAVLVICGLFFWYRAYLMKDKNEKMLMVGFGALFIGFAFLRIFFYLTDMQIIVNYVNLVFYGDINNVIDPIYNTFLTKLGYISAFIAYLVFFFTFEYVTKKSKYLLTIGNFILIGTIIVLPFDISRNLVYIASYTNTLLLISIMLILTKKSHPDFQIVPLAILIGDLTVFVGHSLDASLIRVLELVPTFVPPVLYILGCIIFISPAFYDHEKRSKDYFYWIIFFIFYAFIIGMVIYTSFYLINPFLIDLMFIWWILIVLVGIFSIFLLKRRKRFNQTSQTNIQMDPLSLFTKHVKNEFTKIAQLQHIYIILKSGITIYSQPLLESQGNFQEEKDMFLGSAITAIETFLKEMYQSETVLKEVKQENISILIEEGKYVRIAIIASHDQKSLRKKMQTFLITFEQEFEMPLKENILDTRLFEPVDKLIDRIFK